MKNLITIILSVGLSVSAVWMLFPEMEKYYAEKSTQMEVVATAESQIHQTQPDSEETNDKTSVTAKVLSSERFNVRYSLTNNTNKTIKEVKIRTFYYNKAGEQIHYEDHVEQGTIEPGLSKSYERWKSDAARSADHIKVQVLAYK